MRRITTLLTVAPLCLLLACGDDDDDGDGADTDTDSDTDTDTGSASTEETAWWVATGHSSTPDTGTPSTDSVTGPTGLPSWDSAAGSFFLDSGIPDCDPVPNTDTGLPTTRDDGLAYDTASPDRDGDGHPRGVDCDDLDPYVFPGAPERCDGVDTDCDPLTGEDGLITVDGTSSHSVLVDAVRAASPGSTLVLCPGTYDGPIWLRGDLRIIGREGAEVTTIRSTTTGPNLLRVQKGNLMLAGVTLTGGDVDGALVGGGVIYYWTVPGRPFWPQGAGLSIGECGSAVVRRSVITGNQTYGQGGGVGSAGAPVWLVDTEVSGNVASGDGGGIYTMGALELRDVVVRANQSADGHGGGLYATLATCEVDGVELDGNEAPQGYGGGAQIWRGATLTGQGLVAHDNVAFLGGGLSVLQAQSTLTDGEVWGNTADQGGGLYLGSSEVDLGSVVVHDNEVPEFGGGAFVTSTTVSGGVFESNVAERGGGMTVAGGLRPSTVIGAELRGNTADEGGGLYVSDVCYADDLLVEANDALEGAGVYVAAGGQHGLIATGSVVRANGGADLWSPTTGLSTTFGSPTDFACNGVGCRAGLTTPGTDQTTLPTGDPRSGAPLVADGLHIALHSLDGLVRTWFDTGAGATTQTLSGAGGSFGQALAVEGDILLVAEPQRGPGEVRVYEHDGAAWVETALLSPPVPQGAMRYGRSVALEGDRAVIGAPGADVGGFAEAGEVYVYERSGGLWQLQATLQPVAPEAYAYFGDTVALDGDQLAVAASAAGVLSVGQVTLHERVGAAWSLVRAIDGPYTGARLGLGSLGLSDGWLAAPTTENGAGAPHVRLYEEQGGAWSFVAGVDDPADYPVSYGTPVVSLEGTTLVVGVPYTDDFGASVGAVHRYDDVAGSLVPVSLFHPDRPRGLYLGEGVAQLGDVVLAVGRDDEILAFQPDPADPAW